MLFLCKRRWADGLIALGVLLALGVGLRRGLGVGPPVVVSAAGVGWGLAVFGGVVLSDGLLHQIFGSVWGEAYRRRFRELANLFRDQGNAAILVGALTAGLGEEVVFRGLSAEPALLLGSAAVFGLLHHVRRPLWPFTVWAGFQGVLFGAALYFTGNLLVPVVAHFCHDLSGLLVFRWWNRSFSGGPEASAAPRSPPARRYRF